MYRSRALAATLERSPGTSRASLPAGRCGASRTQAGLDRLTVAIVWRLFELQVDQVAVGAELVVRDGSALSERASGRCEPRRRPRACDAALPPHRGRRRSDRPAGRARAPSRRTPAQAARRRRGPRRALGRAPAGCHGERRRTTRGYSRRSRACTRAARSGHGRPVGFARGALYVREHMRPAEVAPRLDRLCLGRGNRPRGERLEHVLDDVLFGQPLDQLRLL